MNVARLAGLPDDVIKRATSFAARMEADHERRLAGGAAGHGQACGGAAGLPAPAAAMMGQLRAALEPVVEAGLAAVASTICCSRCSARRPWKWCDRGWP